MKIRMQKIDEGNWAFQLEPSPLYELVKDTTQEELYMARHCLSSLCSGTPPYDPNIRERDMGHLRGILQAHSVELVILEATDE
jgi:hypothetical protein